jgi:hypothetical protein
MAKKGNSKQRTTTTGVESGPSGTAALPPLIPTGAHSFIPSGGLTVRKDGVAVVQSKCYKMAAIDLSGLSKTDSTGKMTWKLSDILCVGETINPIEFPISFVATPQIEKPAYMTVLFRKSHATAPYLILDILGWDYQGNPFPDLPFYWYCRVPLIKG